MMNGLPPISQNMVKPRKASSETKRDGGAGVISGLVREHTILKRSGTAGYTDLVMTPVGGLGMTVLEDAVDRLVLDPCESSGSGLGGQRFL